VTDKELPDSRRSKAAERVNEDEVSSAQAKPRMLFISFVFSLQFISLGQFQQRVQQLMTRQKTQLKAKGQRMPSHSELKQPEQIVKKRGETRKKQSLQRARQQRKGGRTNYKNQRQSSKMKHTLRVPPTTKNAPSKRTNKK
jgi:hypothetical protein